MVGGVVQEREEGTPQGAVISPLLANIYLHPVDLVMAAAGLTDLLPELAGEFEVVSSGLIHTTEAAVKEARLFNAEGVAAVVFCPIIWTNDAPVVAFLQEALGGRFPGGIFRGLPMDIPRMTVLLTGVFEEFIAGNRLRLEELSELSDEQIARHFQKADLPVFLVGDLLALVSQARGPLAVRSSSLLEDALYEPFAGVYSTKMVPNNQPDAEGRFRKLVEAVKLVYASTWFRRSRDYCRATGHALEQERMGVIIQELVGHRFHDRFYPSVSGVARSYNYYPLGSCRREDGVAHLALGLGKTIVDGGLSWFCCPAYPRTPPPYNSLRDLAKNTQTQYWAVNLGKPAEYDPTKENEYLVRGDLREAEAEGSLGALCSTWDPASDRLGMGLSGEGPRILDFSPLLQGGVAPLPELIVELLALAGERVQGEVEIEFALALDPQGSRPARFGFLQVRPMAVRRRAANLDPIEALRYET